MGLSRLSLVFIHMAKVLETFMKSINGRFSRTFERQQVRSTYSIGKLEKPEDPEDVDFFNDLGEKMVKEHFENKTR